MTEPISSRPALAPWRRRPPQPGAQSTGAPWPGAPRQEFQSRFGAEQGTAQIHQYDNPIVAVDRFDGPQYIQGVRANGVLGILDAASNSQRHPPLAHLIRQLAHSFGEPGAMGNDHNADHLTEAPILWQPPLTIDRMRSPRVLMPDTALTQINWLAPSWPGGNGAAHAEVGCSYGLLQDLRQRPLPLPRALCIASRAGSRASTMVLSPGSAFPGWLDALYTGLEHPHQVRSLQGRFASTSGTRAQEESAV